MRLLIIICKKIPVYIRQVVPQTLHENSSTQPWFLFTSYNSQRRDQSCASAQSWPEPHCQGTSLVFSWLSGQKFRKPPRSKHHRPQTRTPRPISRTPRNSILAGSSLASNFADFFCQKFLAGKSACQIPILYCQISKIHVEFPHSQFL